MAKKPNTRTGIEPSYKEFLNNVEVYALGLDSISAELKREAYAVAHAESASKVIREIKSQFSLVDLGEEFFDVKATFTLQIKQKDDELLQICPTFTAHFHAEKGVLIEKHAAKFAQLEARLIFWPYFRQTVADITARMHIRSITIPLTLKS